MKIKLSYLDKEELKYVAAQIVWFFIPVCIVFIHEMGHLLFGSLMGLRVEEVFIGWFDGFVRFNNTQMLSLTLLQGIIVFGAGGFMQCIGIYLFSRFVWKGADVFIIPSLIYGLWETGRGIVLTAFNPIPSGLYSAYMSTLDPLLLVTTIGLYIAIAYRFFILESVYGGLV